MAMGTRDGEQEELFITHQQLRSQSHPYYQAVNKVLAEKGFDKLGTFRNVQPRVLFTQLSSAVSENPGMTLPRQVVPGRDYMVTRRCSERRFFLRPNEDTNNAFIYCLALAAKRAKVDVTFSVAMSNHHHTGIHDPDGNFPIFTEHFHGLLARCQNAHLGRFEAFWSSEPTSVVQLVEPNDVLDKMTYAFTNPAAADLVDTVEEWPGVATFQATLSGGHITATRPKHFFRDDGSMPEVVSLRIARPSGFETLRQSEWASLITEHVRAKEADHRQRRAAKDITVLGRHRILQQNPFHGPESHVPRFQMSPRVAAKSKWSRIEALVRDRGFIEKYRDAFLGHIAGLANIVFPFGTYWMRKFGRVACEPAEALGQPRLGPTVNPACA
jgi:REP element-mobilizing transposase RayT